MTFVEVLEMAKAMKRLNLGSVCPDGTKIEASASRHSALSHGDIEKLEAWLEAEVQEPFTLAAMAAAKAKIAVARDEHHADWRKKPRESARKKAGKSRNRGLFIRPMGVPPQVRQAARRRRSRSFRGSTPGLCRDTARAREPAIRRQTAIAGMAGWRSSGR